MPASVQEVSTTKVNFNFQVASENKKVYAGLFKKFADEVSEDHPELAVEFNELGKALNARKKTTSPTTKTPGRRKKTPVRRSESTIDVEEAN